MRIGVDVRPLADVPRSGVGEYTIQLLGALFAHADDDAYTLFANRRRPFPPLPAEWPQRRYQLRHYRHPNKLFNASLLLLHRPTLSSLLPDVDCFFAPNIDFLPPMERPFILTVHDLSFQHYRHLFSWRRRLWHRLVNPAALLRRATGILAVSQATADDVVRTYGLPAEKVRVVHSGVSVPEVTDAAVAQVRKRFQLRTPFLLSLATFEPRKNLATVLDVFRRVRAAGYQGELVLAGAPGWSHAALERELRTHPDRASIHILGHVTDAEKAALYRAADCLLYLSVFEGFGFPPLEALALGTPVVCGAHSALAEVASGALTVDVHNPKDVAIAVDSLLHDAALRSELAREQGSVRERFSWAATAAATHDAFHSFTSSYAHRH